MVDGMKLTIDIPDALSAEARSVARSNGTTIRELVVEGLRDELERCKQATAPAHFSFVTVGGDGLQPGAEPERWVELGYCPPLVRIDTDVPVWPGAVPDLVEFSSS